jgi:hypothetical protein
LWRAYHFSNGGSYQLKQVNSLCKSAFLNWSLLTIHAKTCPSGRRRSYPCYAQCPYFSTVGQNHSSRPSSPLAILPSIVCLCSLHLGQTSFSLPDLVTRRAIISWLHYHNAAFLHPFLQMHDVHFKDLLSKDKGASVVEVEILAGNKGSSLDMDKNKAGASGEEGTSFNVGIPYAHREAGSTASAYARGAYAKACVAACVRREDSQDQPAFLGT